MKLKWGKEMTTSTITNQANQELQKGIADYASYSTLRMIPSVVDGFKNAQRKAFWGIRNFTNGLIKVEQASSRVAEKSEYLHGGMSLSSVIVNMAQDFVGSNNIPYFERKGNFGTRFVNENSAYRYIFVRKNPLMDSIFNEKDDAVLIEQEFEGTKIEPRFYVPILPMILVNGSSGIASGFASRILPRNPKDLLETIKNYLKYGSPVLVPPVYFKGFKGTIIDEGHGKVEIHGDIKKTKTLRGFDYYEISELPIGMELSKYIQILDDLEDNGIINSYEDHSENDSFKFIIKVKNSLDIEKLKQKLKLVTKITENYTVIDENNRVKEFQNANEILEYYIEIRLEYYQKRKDYLIKKLSEDIKLLVSKYLFIKAIEDEELIITKRPTQDIIDDLEKYDKIIKIDGSYQYLLRMPIHSLTKEKMKELMEKIKTMKSEMDKLLEMEPKDMWLEDLDELEI